MGISAQPGRFLAIPSIGIYRGSEKGGPNCGNVPRNGDFALASGVWAPDIFAVGADMRFIGKIPMIFAHRVT